MGIPRDSFGVVVPGMMDGWMDGWMDGMRGMYSSHGDGIIPA
jgi:hypothetical protein